MKDASIRAPLKWSQHVIGRMPMTELWSSEGPLIARRGASVGAIEVAALLARGPVQLVIAVGGTPPQWVPLRETYTVWRDELRAQVVAFGEVRIDLGRYPDGYCYVASRWTSTGRPPIVLFERHG